MILVQREKDVFKGCLYWDCQGGICIMLCYLRMCDGVWGWANGKVERFHVLVPYLFLIIW